MPSAVSHLEGRLRARGRLRRVDPFLLKG